MAIEFSDQSLDTGPQSVRFTVLRKWVLALDEFGDDPRCCGEKILRARQAPGGRSG
ncbi:MAG: Fe-S cluster assembly protein IscX [Gammaproteobacteria bacterium]|nr:Fe-S cluster assembly protein IscX [Gammaproteobacteria bacterium]